LLNFDHPAKYINIEGLSKNVVPLMKIKKLVKCTFPNSVLIPVCPSQVHVLANFAMTVYSSPVSGFHQVALRFRSERTPAAGT
jgi:hypothetical protein